MSSATKFVGPIELPLNEGIPARTISNWDNATDRVTTLDRDGAWTNQQLFDYIATLTYDLQQAGLIS